MTSTGSGPVASVIVPAHDEEARIATTLRTLLHDAATGEFEVVVVCNGCSDGTAEIARSFSDVRVEELDEPSKIAALRRGDVVARTFPRIYLDGDVELPTVAARAIAEALDTNLPRAAGVVARLDTSDATVPARWYFDFRQRLPVFHEGIIGAGVYAMNRTGRDRFGRWPDVVGDDLFVFMLFDRHERITVPGHHTRVEIAPDLRTVLRRQVRVRQGIDDVTTGPHRVARATPPAGIESALREVASRPTAWPGVVVWGAVNTLARIAARLGSGGGDWGQTRR